MAERNTRMCPVTTPNGTGEPLPCTGEMLEDTPLCERHWAMVSPNMRAACMHARTTLLYVVALAVQDACREVRDRYAKGE